MPKPQETDQIDELIARLETSSEGSRELDGEIWRHIEPNADWHHLDIGGDQYIWHQRDSKDSIAFEAPPHYTTSLDTALMLVPEGWFWRVGRTLIYAGWAFIHNTHPDHGEPGRNEFSHSN